MDTCNNCISGIAWDDYDGGQSNECQCHNNGCDQCEDGWFKLDYDFPCQSCSGLVGCMHCADFHGCQQCSDGYTMVEHDSCGEDSVHNTGNIKFKYCVPDGTQDTDGPCLLENLVDDAAEPTDAGCPIVTESDNCNNDENCDDCNQYTLHCETNGCAAGYYLPAHGYICASIADNFGGNCLSASGYSGCISCDVANGWYHYWDASCALEGKTSGAGICVYGNPYA